jgi:hypothetical protein
MLYWYQEHKILYKKLYVVDVNQWSVPVEQRQGCSEGAGVFCLNPCFMLVKSGKVAPLPPDSTNIKHGLKKKNQPPLQMVFARRGHSTD